MKIAIIFLILSAVLFVSGIASLTYSSYSFLEKYPDLQIIFDGELEPGQQITTPINVTKGEQLTITVLTDGSNSLFFYIEDAQQDIVTENVFIETMSYPLVVNQSGVHIIGVGNMGDTNAQIGNFITEYPIAEPEFVKGLGYYAIIGSLLIFISIILFLIGLVIYLVQRKLKPQKSKSL